MEAEERHHSQVVGFLRTKQTNYINFPDALYTRTLKAATTVQQAGRGGQGAHKDKDAAIDFPFSVNSKIASPTNNHQPPATRAHYTTSSVLSGWRGGKEAAEDAGRRCDTGAIDLI